MQPPLVSLEGVEGPAILTRVRVISTVGVRPGSKLAACIRRTHSAFAAGTAVQRIGVSGESVTFTDATRTGLHACDNTNGAREDGRRWCGTSFGRLTSGRLQDPRLDIVCTSEGGSPLGFVWVEPSLRARYVVVQHHGYSEAYEVAAGLPVRVSAEASTGASPLGVTIRLAECDTAGKLLRRFRLTAIPTG